MGSYRIDEALAARDAFQVFRAWDVARERHAILEIAWPGVGGADAAGARLVRESELLARAVELAEDSHLIAIYEVGTIEVRHAGRVASHRWWILEMRPQCLYKRVELERGRSGQQLVEDASECVYFRSGLRLLSAHDLRRHVGAFDPVIQRAMSSTPEQPYFSAGELGRAAVTAARAGTAA